MPAPLLLENVTLRPAIATDVDWAAPLVFAAGPALFSYVFATAPAQATDILKQAFAYPNHAFSYEYAQVVEVADQPAGLVIGYAGQLKRQVDDKVHQVMARILPLTNLPRILVNVADLTRIKQDVAPEDYYILSLSIAPEFRNQGLGTALLGEMEVQAQEAGCRSLCLDVSYKNVAARALFQRLGYQVTCSKTSDRFQQITRAGGLHRMEKRLG
jgi:ribosomal protein S18 acetylase RimI-like enzyme